jgi:hypothetical protein
VFLRLKISEKAMQNDKIHIKSTDLELNFLEIEIGEKKERNWAKNDR